MQPDLSVWFVLIVSCIVTRSVAHDFQNTRELYEEFKLKYRKNYANDDDHKRFAIFKNNLKRVQEFQENDHGTAEFGVTQFSDLTLEEFRLRYANARFNDKVERVDESVLSGDLAPAPTSFDWREHGAVGPVLNQGECGSCWAFSIIGNIEGQWFLKTGKLLKLSEQQLVDCDMVDGGCEGGFPPQTYAAIKRLGGLQLSADYPYRGVMQWCKMDKSKLKVYLNSSLILPKNEIKQAAWLAQHGPLASSLNADTLQFYHRGILHSTQHQCPSAGLNHAVLTVGYGVEKGKPFWIVKNSWDTTFGENGYFRIYRGDGTCGIDQECTTAIIK